jgi:hypothetical protein
MIFIRFRRRTISARRPRVPGRPPTPSPDKAETEDENEDENEEKEEKEEKESPAADESGAAAGVRGAKGSEGAARGGHRPGVPAAPADVGLGARQGHGGGPVHVLGPGVRALPPLPHRPAGEQAVLPLFRGLLRGVAQRRRLVVLPPRGRASDRGVPQGAARRAGVGLGGVPGAALRVRARRHGRRLGGVLNMMEDQERAAPSGLTELNILNTLKSIKISLNSIMSIHHHYLLSRSEHYEEDDDGTADLHKASYSTLFLCHQVDRS